MATPISYKARQDAALQKAKSSLAKKDDNKAMRYFKQACIYCDCNKTFLQSFFEAAGGTSDANGVPLPSCHCREVLSLNPNHDDKQAIYKLATQPCTCGSGVNLCGIQAHVDGLNGMAAICGRQKAYKDARKYASLLILIAPRNPTGYLRLAKCMRLQDISDGTDTRKRWEWVYSQLRGIDPEKLKNLVHVIRVDIISKTPPEVQEAILQYLSTRDLCRCMRVSKAWKHTTYTASLWRHLEFIKRGPSSRVRPFAKGVLTDIVSRRSRNLAQSLVISGWDNFSISADTLGRLLKALPQLQNLSLCDVAPYMVNSAIPRPVSFAKYSDVICRDAPASLKSLRIERVPFGARDDGMLRRLMPSTVNFASSLRVLELVNLGFAETFLNSEPPVQWSSLETLRIANFYGNIILEHLIAATPLLKDVYLDTVGFVHAREHPPCHWQNLERFILVNTLINSCPILPGSRKLRFLELYNEGKMLVHFTGEEETWDQLEHFRYVSKDLRDPTTPITAPQLTRLIQPSSVSRTLRSLELDWGSPMDEDAIDKTVIHVLGCYNMAPPSIHPDGHPGAVDDFLDWLDGFSNITTLGIFPLPAPKAWVMVAKFVRKLDDKSSLVKTIYTNALYGVYRDAVIAEGAKKGIAIIDADRMPEPKFQPLAGIAPPEVA